MIAFVFPGQGAQKVGMGRSLAASSSLCRETFAEADEALGESLSTLCFDGPADRLMLTENTQPAILAMSTAACRLLEIGTEQGRPVEEIGLTSRVLEVFRSADSAPALVPVGDRIVVLSARRDRTDVESLTDNSTACI